MGTLKLRADFLKIRFPTAVSFPGFDQGKVPCNGLFHDVLSSTELTVLGRGDGREGGRMSTGRMGVSVNYFFIGLTFVRWECV